MFNGIYEQLISRLVESELKTVNREQFFVKESPIEKSEASKLLSQYLSEVINCALGLITDEKSIEQQIEVSNKIILNPSVVSVGITERSATSFTNNRTDSCLIVDEIKDISASNIVELITSNSPASTLRII